MFAHVNPRTTVQIIKLVRADEIVFKSHQYVRALCKIIHFRNNILDSKRVVTHTLSYKRISEPRPMYTGRREIYIGAMENRRC